MGLFVAAHTFLIVMQRIKTRQTYSRWTAEEEEYLEQQIESMPAIAIALKLDRTVQSVETKAIRMGYSIVPTLNCFSARYLAISAGIHPSTLQRWVRIGLLRSHRLSPGKWAIKKSDFKQFITKYPNHAQRMNQEFLQWLLN